MDAFGKFKNFEKDGKRCLRVEAGDLEGSEVSELVEAAEEAGFEKFSVAPELESLLFSTLTVFLRPEPVSDKLEIAVEQRGDF
ncbi:MAG: hypothetical protein ABEK16_03150 [Candidatus Nanohalobium sp.]